MHDAKFTVNADRNKLCDTLRKNLTEHLKTHSATLTAWRKKVAETFGLIAAEAEGNIQIESKMDEIRAKVHALLDQPRDHADDYRKLISTLGLHTTDTIDLPADLVNRIVNDDWHWRREWDISNSTYAG